MATKITRDIIESYLNCKYKGHRRLAGESGMPSDYETMTTAKRQASREQAVATLVARFGQGDAGRGRTATAAVLRQGTPLLADVDLEDEGLSLRCEALKRAGGASKLGDHHYVPVLHGDGDRLSRRQKLLLAVLALLLSRVQGVRPATGLVARGTDGRLGKVRLDAKLYRQAEQVLGEVKRLQEGGEPPRLTLNGHCQFCEFRQRCHTQAEQADDISLLRGMKEKEVRAYARKGILTIAQLSHVFRPRRQNKRQEQRTHRRYHALHALAIRDKKVYVFGSPTLPGNPVRIYLDMEGDPEEGYVYLIGLVVARDGAETRYSFWAESKEQEKEIFEQFLAVVSRYEGASLFCYGGYEPAFLKRMRKVAESKEQVDQVLGALVNVLSLVYSHVYFPCYSNGLKDVGNYLGCRWTEPDASSIQSIVWRKRWENTRCGEWKQKLLTYNLEDCAALKKVTAFLSTLQSRALLSGNQTGEDSGVPPFASAEDLKPPSTRRTWCKAEFFIPEFAEINDCAYFNYQRDKVYVRTSRTIARASRRRKKGKGARRLRVNKRVELSIDECHHCKSKELIPSDGKVRKKVLYDLTFSPGGIRRRVIECVARQYCCAGCGTQLFPDRFHSVAKHQHALKSWVVFEQVAHHVSCAKIGMALEDYFGLHVNNLYLVKFKDLMARYYQTTYEGLLKRLIAGHLIHADETKIELKSGEGYVWVFTNLEEVVFLYKPNREGGFLHELLRGFKGVLVSDFFTAYDSLPCPQQKCLIHLIRDLNHDLFQSPYDVELRSVASQFGELLRSIIRTVDQHGLRSKYLSLHKNAVDRFFRTLSEPRYASEVAQGYQVRFAKSREKLFTFLDHDGVPWNNNNAEHAIKQFAYYRRTSEGHITPAGLQEYLVLLSIQQTCRYKGVNFLRFLLSRELDIDSFCAGTRNRTGPPPLDVYPAGFSFRRFGDRKRYEN